MSKKNKPVVEPIVPDAIQATKGKATKVPSELGKAIMKKPDKFTPTVLKYIGFTHEQSWLGEKNTTKLLKMTFIDDISRFYSWALTSESIRALEAIIKRAKAAARKIKKV